MLGATPIHSATRRRFSRTLRLIVMRSGADVEALVDAVRNAADAGEIAVADAGGCELIEHRRAERVRFCARLHCRLVVSRSRFVKTRRRLAVPVLVAGARQCGRAGVQVNRSEAEGRQPNAGAAAIASTLNSVAHRVGRRQGARPRPAVVSRAAASAPGAERAGTFEQAHAEQEVALRRQMRVEPMRARRMRRARQSRHAR